MSKLQQKWLIIAFIFILFIIIYWPVIKELMYDWSHDDNYSHGFLIPVISLYFVWQKKELLLIDHQRTGRMWGLAILIFGLLMYIVGTAAAEWFITRVSLLVVLAGIVIYLWGTAVGRKVWFPILFLFFMIPLPYVIYYAMTFPMQLLSTKAAAFVLKLSGFTILRQGNIIHLPNYALEVVEACSGLRSLMTLSALGAAMAYLTQRNLFTGLVLFLTAIPIAIIANVIRIIITAIGAYLISPKFADGFLHEASGLVVFSVGLISLAGMAYLLSFITRPLSRSGDVASGNDE